MRRFDTKYVGGGYDGMNWVAGTATEACDGESG